MNRATIRSLIRERYGLSTNDVGLTDSVLNNFINAALRQVTLDHDWPWLLSRQTGTLSLAGDITMPTDWLRTVALVLPSEQTVLEPVSAQELEIAATYTTVPSMYVVLGTTIKVAPLPDQGYSFVHWYISQENTLTTDADSPKTPDSFIDGIIDLAAAYAFTNARQDDRATAALNSYQIWLRRSRDNAARTVGSFMPRIRPGGWL